MESDASTDVADEEEDVDFAACSGPYELESRTVNLFQSALLVRSDLMAVRESMTWPPSPAVYITEDAVDFTIPITLYNLLAWIIAGDKMHDTPIANDGRKVKVANEEEHRRILLIAQDILYCTRKGHLKPPKHVVLGMVVHHLTRSKEL